jgi:hypothetical protein
MKPKAGWLERVCKRNPHAPISGRWFRWIEEEWAKAEKVGDAIIALRRRREDEARRHAAAVKEIEAAVADCQRVCVHDHTTFHGDPAGGSDSHTTCDLCGAIV